MANRGGIPANLTVLGISSGARYYEAQPQVTVSDSFGLAEEFQYHQP